MRYKKIYPLLLCVFLVALIGGLIGEARAQNEGEVVKAATALASLTDIEEQVFPKDKVVDVKITMDQDDFQDMLDNASAEELKTASVEYNGIKLDHIGIRTKGNLSLRSVVSSDSDRYSFKLSFDEYISSQTLLGIGKINLNNNYSDATSMREFLTYELAESMGLPTPEYSYVNVYVNGELWGFYLAIEQIGDSYLERNFDNSYGALYKAEFGGGGASGGGDLVWQDDKIDSYPSLVQKSDSSNEDILIDMLDELNNGTDYEKVLDVDQALKYIALNAVTVNMDSYLGSNQQNYYLYEDDGIFNVLPWDYNMSFGGMGSSSQVMIDEPTQGAVAERALIDKLLQVEEYKEKYHEIIKQMVEGYLADDTFAARVQEIQELISSHVEQDPRPFYTYEVYESAIPQLVTFTSTRVENVTGQLDGSIASSGDGSGSGGGMGGGGMDRGMNAGGMVRGERTGFGGGQGRQTNQVVSAAVANPVTVADTTDTGQTQNGPGERTQNGQDVQTQNGQDDPIQNGQLPGGQMPEGFPDGQIPEGFPGGQMPEGMQGGGFGGGQGRPDGMGMGGGFGGATAQPQGSTEDAITTAVALAVLLLAGLFVIFYKRKRL
jgi:spore coat protein CotH